MLVPGSVILGFLGLEQRFPQAATLRVMVIGGVWPPAYKSSLLCRVGVQPLANKISLKLMLINPRLSAKTFVCLEKGIPLGQREGEAGMEKNRLVHGLTPPSIHVQRLGSCCCHEWLIQNPLYNHVILCLFLFMQCYSAVWLGVSLFDTHLPTCVPMPVCIIA